MPFIDTTAIDWTTVSEFVIFGIVALIALYVLYQLVTRVISPLIHALIASNKERAEATLTLTNTLKENAEASKTTADVLANLVEASKQLKTDSALIIPAMQEGFDGLRDATKTIATDVAASAVTDIKRTLKADADATRAGFASVREELSGIRADMQTDRAADRKWGDRIEQTIRELGVLVAGLSAGAENKTSAVSAAPVVGDTLSDG